MCLETVFNGITTVATVAIAVASYLALASWRKEKKYDLAEKIVTLSHEVEDRLKQVRFLHIMEGENTRFNKNPESQVGLDEERIDIFNKRLNDNWTTFSRLYSMKLRAGLRFKKERIDKDIEELIKIIREIQTDAGVLAHGIKAGVDITKDNTLRECKRSIISFGKDDKIADTVGQIVKTIEQKLRPYYDQ